MRVFGAARALLRIELRAARQHSARSWLVVLLVAVPVAAMVGGSAVFFTTQSTLEETLARDFGGAALRLDFGQEATEGEVRALVGAAATFEGLQAGRAEVGPVGASVATRLLATNSRSGQPSLALGMLEIVEGRAPRETSEVALAGPLVRAFELSLGEQVLVDGVARTITGIVVDPNALDAAVALGIHDGPAHVWLLDAPPDELDAIATSVSVTNARIALRNDAGSTDGFEALVVFVVGGFAFFEAALVIGAAFAVGIRRRQREVGLVGVSGASTRDITLALVISTLALATAGIAIGLAVGFGAAHAVHPWLDGWNHRWNGPLEISWPHVLGAVALGWAASLAAVAGPAWSAARLPIRVALSGRRPVAESSRSWLVFGLSLVALGFGWMMLGVRSEGARAAVGILGGSVVGVLGLGACSPWLLGVLARWAAPLPLAWRLAARDAGRFRARNGPVVLAVLAGLSVSVMLASIARSVNAWTGVRVNQVSTADGALVDFATIASLLTGLIVVFIATALANAESTSDARVLDAVGAPPGVLRTHTAARASYLALLGALLAIPAGLIPCYGLLEFADVDLEFQAPWGVLALSLVGLPTLAFAGAWLAAAFGGAATRRSFTP